MAIARNVSPGVRAIPNDLDIRTCRRSRAAVDPKIVTFRDRASVPSAPARAEISAPDHASESARELRTSIGGPRICGFDPWRSFSWANPRMKFEAADLS
jgi:hypothetical protein